MLLLLALACSTEPAPPEPPAQEAAAGTIGGMPILSKTVVLGGLDAAAVDGVVARHQGALDACIGDARQADPTLAGKVLVRFAILPDGTVGDARVRSTSLRDAPTESCVVGVLQRARFPVLDSGEKALVDLPVDFPAA